MANNLYQLTSAIRNLPVGTPFTINGPYDVFGYVVKRLEKRATESLYLIRGTGREPR